MAPAIVGADRIYGPAQRPNTRFEGVLSYDLAILLLGIDTGGTYTDAVIYDDVSDFVVAKAKAPTSLDLATGIDGAISAALTLAGCAVTDVAMVSLSTTLATNALVENKGRAACIVVLGFEGLEPLALDDDVFLHLPGGHNSQGVEQHPLDLDELASHVSGVAAEVEAFAVTGEFSVRNAAHELAAGELISRLTGKPVTLSHQLSAKLNGPKRAMTALLNARLISLTRSLMDTAQEALTNLGITAPLMVVRGDGSLVSVDFAIHRPIETILSGPAASIMGAAHLTDVADAIVVDIGGTTTDIALLRSGRPQITEDGAVVGDHATMVEAVDIRTYGLGGDSQVAIAHSAVGPELDLGPRRIVPLSLLSSTSLAATEAILDQQLAKWRPSETDGYVVLPGDDALPVALSDLATTAVARRQIERDVQRGNLRLSGFTPTDAALILGSFEADAAVSTAAAASSAVAESRRRLALKGATLFGKQPDRYGDPIAAGIVAERPEESATDSSAAEGEAPANAIAAAVVDSVIDRSAELLLETGLREDGLDPNLVTSALLRRSLDERRQPMPGAESRVIDVSVRLDRPIVALGAPAGYYYPEVGQVLGTAVIIPEHADVANAVGAVVGQVRMSREITIDGPRRGSFVVMGDGDPVVFFDLDEAKVKAGEILSRWLDLDMEAAGAADFEIEWGWQPRVADMDGDTYFVRGTLTAAATGRPRLARAT